jgi:hypothetical protein
MTEDEEPKRYPLAGSPIRYIRPTDPVAEEDWNALADGSPPDSIPRQLQDTASADGEGRTIRF